MNKINKLAKTLNEEFTPQEKRDLIKNLKKLIKNADDDNLNKNASDIIHFLNVSLFLQGEKI